MMAESKAPRVLMIMLCMRCKLGGAEKRYARVFEMLASQPDSRHKLMIDRALLDLLQSTGILVRHDSHLIVVEPLFRHGGASGDANRIRKRIVSFLKPVTVLLNALGYVWQCWRVIRRYRPAVVHPLLAGVLFSLPALKLQPRITHVMSAYTAFVPPYEAFEDKRVLGINPRGRIRRHAFQRCHIIDALSPSIRDNLVAVGIEGGKIRVAPCSFTDVSLCQPATQRNKWVVFLGRFIDTKNPLLLVQAIPGVLAYDREVHFFFLGRGYLQSQLESLVVDLDISENVTIRFDPRPTRILNQSSIYVSLQVRENYPSQSLLEAMACGNAIVATDVGETWRLVDDANGKRVSPTADALADAIVSLLKDPLLTQRGLDSRRRVLEEHTPQRYAAHIVDLYETGSRLRRAELLN